MAECMILLVDDDPIFWELIQTLARHYVPTWEIVPVATLGEALAHLEQQSYDLVLLDLNLQEVQGLLTLHRFFALRKDKGVVVLTGLPDELAPAILAAGAVGFMNKMDMTQNPVGFWAFLESCRIAAHEDEGGDGRIAAGSG